MDIGEASVNFPVNRVPDGSQAGHDGAVCFTHRTNLHPGCLVHPPPCLHQHADPPSPGCSTSRVGSVQPGRILRLMTGKGVCGCLLLCCFSTAAGETVQEGAAEVLSGPRSELFSV